jgi:peptidoglycan/LPS O-acetylase OafA/YrhL
LFTAVQIAVVLGQVLAGILIGHLMWRFGGRSSGPDGRLGHLEGLRGIAALAVVACHTTQHIVARLGFEGSPDAGNRLGILGVQMFFALTAFLFVRRILSGTLDPIDFMAGRIRRIVPLYLFLCVAALCIGALLYSPVVQPLSQTARELAHYFAFGFVGGDLPTLLGQTMAPWTGIAWTLPYEWEFYLLVPVIAVAVRSRLGVVVGTAVFVLAAAYDLAQLTESVWPFFGAGVGAAFVERYLPAPGRALRIGIAASILPLVGAALAAPGFFSAWQLPIAALLFLAVLLSRPRLLTTGALQSLGRVSYSIYLMQYLVMTPLVTMGFRYPELFTSGVLHDPGPVVLTVAILVPLSYVTWRFIERPWMRSSTERDSALRRRPLAQGGPALDAAAPPPR